MNRIKLIAAMLALGTLAGCDNDARVASHNLSKAADNFEINRRIVFYNGINGGYMLSLEGRCSFDASQARKVDVTCKIGPNEYKKHSLGLSDNVTYFSEQLNGADVSVYHYRVIFKPQTILPDVDFKGSSQAIGDALTK
uniref:Lipoprotein n=1 Tax=Pseudomonas phage Touem01 TaxID=3138548 RepID=A0AAU6W260_9VIRU